MNQQDPLTQAELDSLTIEQLAALEEATQKLGDEAQGMAAYYQRQADRYRKNLKRRRRA